MLLGLVSEDVIAGSSEIAVEEAKGASVEGPVVVEEGTESEAEEAGAGVVDKPQPSPAALTLLP